MMRRKFPKTDWRYRTGEQIHVDDRGPLVREVAALYAAGFTIRQIASGSGRSYGGTRKLLKEAGVVPRRGTIGGGWRKKAR